MPGVALVNTGDPELEYAFYEAERRVLGIQAKLHRRLPWVTWRRSIRRPSTSTSGRSRNPSVSRGRSMA